MTKPMIAEIDTQTGGQTLREMNAQELTQYNADKTAHETSKINQLNAESAKAAAQAKLAALGLSTDDLKALGL